MGCVGLVVVLCLALSQGAVAHQRDESDMAESNEEEFPFAASDDSMAGAPGSSEDDPRTQIGAAHTTAQQEAATDCDMTGVVGDVDEDEEVVPRRPIAVNQTLSHSFVCKLTSDWPVITPHVAQPFNLLQARFEGNDGGGQAHQSLYSVQRCGCVCSGGNANCGPQGSTNYYADVPTEAACAQMMCHVNRFSACAWDGRVIARGLSLYSAMWFNTSALSPGGSVANLTRAFNAIVRSEASPSPSPSFSASPSPTPSPLFPELVNARALALIELASRAMCLDAASLVAKIIDDIASVDLSKYPPVVCSSTVGTSPVGQSAEEIVQSTGTDRVAANALAGFSDLSPLFDDATHSTFEGMNSNTLVQLAQLGLPRVHPNVTAQALRVIGRVFNTKLPRAVQCAPGTHPLEVVVRQFLLLDATEPCPRRAIQSFNTTRALYIVLVERVRQTLPAPSPVPRHRPPPVVVPPVFPPLAPAPNGANAEQGAARAGMEGEDLDCEGGDEDEPANVEQAGAVGPKPGAPVPLPVINVARDELPAFGTIHVGGWASPPVPERSVVVPQPARSETVLDASEAPHGKRRHS